MKKITIYTDGGARGNPGPAGIGVVVLENHQTLEEYKEFLGEKTNNQAEYLALIKGLKIAKKYSPDLVECFLDSELIVNQLRGDYKVKNQGLKDLFLEAKKKEKDFKAVFYKYISRDKNKRADKLVNQAIDLKS